jgi:hypothetical protein
MSGLCIWCSYQHFKLLEEIIMVKLLLKFTQFFVVAVIRYKDEIDIIYLALKKRSAEALTLGFLLCLLLSTARAQEVSGDKSPQTTSVTSGTNNKEKEYVEKIEGNAEKPLSVANKIESLQPSWAGRFARGFQYDYKLTQQRGSVFVSELPTEKGEITGFIRNPQNYLQQHTITFKFGELFPDSLSLFKAGSDYLKKHPRAAGNSEELSNIFCKGKPLITCLAKGGSWWKRALMGTSINLNFTERTVVQDGLIVSPAVFGQKYLVNGGFTFDPAKLFINASSWKKAFDKVQEADKTLALLKANDEGIGSRRKPWRQPWAAALVPKVELKVLSQFDYVTLQGRLREAPFPERALNNLTFTWDLTRAIPDTQSRIDADAAYEAYNELKNNLGRPEVSTWEKQCNLYFDKDVEPSRKIKDVHPVLFRASSCQKLADALNAKNYQLSCIFNNKGKEGEKEPENASEKSLAEALVSPYENNKCGW